MKLSKQEYEILDSLQKQRYQAHYTKGSYNENPKSDLSRLRNSASQKPASLSISEMPASILSQISQLRFQIALFFGFERESDSKRKERADLYKITIAGTAVCILSMAAAGTSEKANKQVPTIAEILAMHK